MKKIYLILLIVIGMLAFSACGARNNIYQPEESPTQESFTPIGSWTLDVEKNREIDFRNLFGSMYLNTGSSMEIASDGTFSIYIGSYGGTGTWTSESNKIYATFKDQNEGQEHNLLIYKIQDVAQNYLKTNIMETDMYFVKGENIIQTPSVEYTPEPTPAPQETPNPTATPSIVYVDTTKKVTITKNPTSETVAEGGSASFIARADNAESIVWIIVSPDAKTTYFNANDATSAFPGLKVEGQGSEKLVLSNIPYEMNGYRIQCYFTGNGGPLYSSGAYLTMTKEEQKDTISQLAKDNAQIVKKYAENSHWNISEIQNYVPDNGNGFEQFSLTLTRGAVNLVIELKVYTAENACYPESLTWHESYMQMGKYEYGRADTEAWNHLEKTILDITDKYGDGTAGQSMQ